MLLAGTATAATVLLVLSDVDVATASSATVLPEATSLVGAAATLIAGAITKAAAKTPVSILLMILDFIILSSICFLFVLLSVGYF